ncbi:hypothetical protein [Trichococcus shcherbakoviae]|uniref:hypothetical protein n=1 Tax=Trichococcus shcherbakoviae TaxID=2094020 RepID=UPI002AA640E8|nr:hypothetical protein [Trichococcus shcherbakoviae]
MALRKTKNARGVSGDYWQIHHKNYNKDTGKTSAELRCYVSADVRTTDAADYLDMSEFRTIVEFDGDLTTAELYAKCKESAPVDGAETNWFVDAEDC